MTLFRSVFCLHEIGPFVSTEHSVCLSSFVFTKNDLSYRVILRKTVPCYLVVSRITSLLTTCSLHIGAFRQARPLTMGELFDKRDRSRCVTNGFPVRSPFFRRFVTFYTAGKATFASGWARCAAYG